MQTEMKVELLAHTQMDQIFKLFLERDGADFNEDGSAIALTAIRNCYSHLKPSQVLIEEGHKYFGQKAKDGQAGTEADRLLRVIRNSGHTSTIEHLSYTFAIEGVSRALLAQLTRHRVGFSFSVESQRYVKLDSGSRSEGFDYVVPDAIKGNEEALKIFEATMKTLQSVYDMLREEKVTAEDARSILPNACATNIVMTVNLRSVSDFYLKRGEGTHAQSEIQQLAEKLKREVLTVDPWARGFFEREGKR